MIVGADRECIPLHGCQTGDCRRKLAGMRAWSSVRGISHGAEYDAGKPLGELRSLWHSPSAGALQAAPSPGRRCDVAAGSDDTMLASESCCWTVTRPAAVGSLSDHD